MSNLKSRLAGWVTLVFELSIFLCIVREISCGNGACYKDNGEPITCLTYPKDVAYGRKISATNTCGSPKAGFCELGAMDKDCYMCDAASDDEKHPPQYMVDDKHNPYTGVTWWQSQNWWEANRTYKDPLKVNVTVSFGKRYLITGGVKVTFMTSRPKAMILQQSKDYGITWEDYQYFADNCQVRYGMETVKDCNINKATCTEDFSGTYPRKWGNVKFQAMNCYDTEDIFDPTIQSYLKATDVRLILEYPGTDGLERFFSGEDLNRYFYAIANIDVDARCSCNGHAEFCNGERMEEFCECEHDTAGKDCQRCKPLFNNRPWLPANSTHANECQECDCNHHGTSCKYNTTLGYGTCRGCKNNTQGLHCEECMDKYYRNSEVSSSDPNTCLACDCFLLGVTDDGNCLQQADETHEIGQCFCKENVQGRRCDQCKPTFWGYKNDPVGHCQSCDCNNQGTVNGEMNCDQYNGQCECKSTTQGQHCEECLDGYYSFPGCTLCPCDLGGAFPKCQKQTGQCFCREGVHGALCTSPTSGHFFPDVDHNLLEAEFMHSMTPPEQVQQEFTGLGCLRLSSDIFSIKDTFTLPFTHDYHIMIRFEPLSIQEDAKLVFDITGLEPMEVTFNELSNGSTESWISEESVHLEGDKELTINITLLGTLNSTICIDSLALVPDVESSRIFKLSSASVQSTLRECVKNSSSLALKKQRSPECKKLIFSLSTELNDGTLVCDCHISGTDYPQLCDSFGGQCKCREGVGGRRCDHCVSEYYDFSSTGCKSCGCSDAGSLTKACNMSTGECDCKTSVEGDKCDACNSGTFNLVASSPDGCQPCFGFNHGTTCESADDFIAAQIETDFISVNQTEIADTWKVVDFTESEFNIDTENVTVTDNGVQVVSPSCQLWFKAPQKFLGNQLSSYRQVIKIQALVNDNISGEDWGVQLESGAKRIFLPLIPEASSSVTTYWTRLDEFHTLNSTLEAGHVQAIMAQLTSIKIKVCGSVMLQHVTMETAVEDEFALPNAMVQFVEKVACHANYSGLSCESCAQGFTREIPGSDPYGRCVLCSCTDRSTECNGETGVCINCREGTQGDHCELCRDNVEGENCEKCSYGYWGLSNPDGCIACQCYLPGTAGGNASQCDDLTGQCVCNQTLNLGGLYCDQCKDNAYNTTPGIYSCKVCSECHGLIDVEVEKFRVELVKLEELVDEISTSSVVKQDQTLLAQVKEIQHKTQELKQHANNSYQEEKYVTQLWDDLSEQISVLETIMANVVVQSIEVTMNMSNLLNNLYVNTSAIVNLIGEINEDSHNLLSMMSSVVNQIKTQDASMVHQLSELKNLSAIAEALESLTENASMIIVKKSNRSVEVMTQSAVNASATVTLHHQVTERIASLYNSSLEILVLGKETDMIANHTLRNTSLVLVQAVHLLELASLPLEDNSEVLNNLTMMAAHVKESAMNYATNALAMMDKTSFLEPNITAVVQEANALVAQMLMLKNNITSLLSRSQDALNVGQEAIKNAVDLQQEAEHTLEIVSQFDIIAKKAEDEAQQYLNKTPSINESLESYISDSKSIRQSASSAINMSVESLRMMKHAHEVALEEKQISAIIHERTMKLHNKTIAANELIQNLTVKEYIKNEVKPLLDQCSNASELVSETQRLSNEILEKNQDIHNLTSHLNLLVVKLLEDGQNLPTVNSPRLSELQAKIAEMQIQFINTNVPSGIETLKEGVEMHEQWMEVTHAAVKMLNSEMQVAKALLQSLKSVDEQTSDDSITN